MSCFTSSYFSAQYFSYGIIWELSNEYCEVKIQILHITLFHIYVNPNKAELFEGIFWGNGGGRGQFKPLQPFHILRKSKPVLMQLNIIVKQP